MPLPALRPVELIPFEQDGQTMICLQDSSGLVEHQMVMSPAAAFAALQLDGVRGFEEVAHAFSLQFPDTELPLDAFNDILAQLDEFGFLYTDSFEKIQVETESAYLANPVRPAYLAGKSYPDDPEELRSFLDQQFMREGGPKSPLAHAPGDGMPLKGLVVPHIDFNRGGHAYAWGYREFYAAGKPDTVIIFGVAHAMEPVPFILTRKDFDTPLGTVSTDRDMVDQLASSCTWDPFAFEMTHRTEHSIEFQALMLSHLYGSDVKIVPVLVSHFGEDGPGESDDPLHTFLDACKNCVTDSDKKVSVIASVDLAHVGRRFGDEFDIDEPVVDEVASRDREDLAHLETPDATNFFGSVMKDHNRRNVCGLNAIYATLKTLEGSTEVGEPLHYDFAHDPAGGIVSFASYALR